MDKFKNITDLLKFSSPYDQDIKRIDPETGEEIIINKSPNKEPVEELFSWDIKVAPYRVPKKILRSIFVFVFLFAVFLILSRDWVFLILILSFAFLFNLIINSPEKNLKYKLFSNGIDYDGMFITWDECTFYFFYDGIQNMISINTKDAIPGRVYVYFDEEDKDKIDKILNKYISKLMNHPKDFFEIIIYKLKPYLNLSDEK